MSYMPLATDKRTCINSIAWCAARTHFDRFQTQLIASAMTSHLSLPEDVLPHILDYLCSPHDIAARRWCLNKAWLAAHAAPVHWRMLVLATHLPLGHDGITGADAHCLCSAWERAPRQLRLAVERHTRHVFVEDGDTHWSEPPTPYSLGRGLAGQRFARLEKVSLYVWNHKKTQHADDVEAALSPLFGAECLYASMDGCLRGVSPRAFYSKFPNLRRLELPDGGADIFLDPDTSKNYPDALLALDGESSDRVERLTYLDREKAVRLIELRSLHDDSIISDAVPDGMFPHMTFLELSAWCELPKLGTIFARVAAVCPVLELLSLHFDSLRTTWDVVGNYSVFASAPRSLKAIVLIFNSYCNLPFPTASPLVALIQSHLPAGIQVHIVACRDVIPEDDGLLPEGFWEPDQFPGVGENYDDAALARASFSYW